MWCNALKLMLAGGLERGGTDCVFEYEGCCSTLKSRTKSFILEHIVSASAFQATGQHQLECITPHYVKRSLGLLRMGKKLPETC